MFYIGRVVGMPKNHRIQEKEQALELTRQRHQDAMRTLGTIPKLCSSISRNTLLPQTRPRTLAHHLINVNPS